MGDKSKAATLAHNLLHSEHLGKISYKNVCHIAMFISKIVELVSPEAHFIVNKNNENKKLF